MLALTIVFAFLSGKTENYWVFGIFVLIVGLLLQGIEIIQNNPSHIGIVTKWDEKLWKTNEHGEEIICYIEEGWNWLFLKGLMHKIIPLNMSKREIEFPRKGEEDIVLTTPDQITTGVRFAISYKPQKESTINLLNLGTDDPFQVFENMLESVSLDRLREWAINGLARPAENEMYYEVLQRSGDQAIKLLIGEISEDRPLDPGDFKKIKSGNGNWPMPEFGTTLTKVNIEKLKPFGELYESALLIKTEENERRGETLEVRGDFQKALALQKDFNDKGVNKSIEECLEIVMGWKFKAADIKSTSLGNIASIIGKSLKGG